MEKSKTERVFSLVKQEAKSHDFKKGGIKKVLLWIPKCHLLAFYACKGIKLDSALTTVSLNNCFHVDMAVVDFTILSTYSKPFFTLNQYFWDNPHMYRNKNQL